MSNIFTCPKCSEKSLIKRPGPIATHLDRIVYEYHDYKCLSTFCYFVSEREKVYSEYGKAIKNPTLWTRIKIILGVI